jgi:hypothetical protein
MYGECKYKLYIDYYIQNLGYENLFLFFSLLFFSFLFIYVTPIIDLMFERLKYNTSIKLSTV